MRNAARAPGARGAPGIHAGTCLTGRTPASHTRASAALRGLVGKRDSEGRLGVRIAPAVKFQAGALGGEHDGFLALLQLVALPREFGKALRSID